MDLSWLEASLDVRPLRRSEYDRLVEAGAFENERVELVRGILLAMSPQGPGHAYATRKLNRILVVAVGERAEVQSHSPIALGDDSEPEPDVALIPPGGDARSLPTSPLLVVEVSDSSLGADRKVKAILYAQAGIPEYWIVSLPEDLVEVRDQPENGVYQRLRTVRRGESIQLVSFPDIRVLVDAFLPKA